MGARTPCCEEGALRWPVRAVSGTPASSRGDLAERLADALVAAGLVDHVDAWSKPGGRAIYSIVVGDYAWEMLGGYAGPAVRAAAADPIAGSRLHRRPSPQGRPPSNKMALAAMVECVELAIRHLGQTEHAP